MFLCMPGQVPYNNHIEFAQPEDASRLQFCLNTLRNKISEISKQQGSKHPLLITIRSKVITRELKCPKLTKIFIHKQHATLYMQTRKNVTVDIILNA